MSDKPICLVLGGSFNPPTLAHQAIAKTCTERISKITGRDATCVLVPSSHNYVSRKMSKAAPGQNMTFPEQMRMQMCRDLISGIPGAILSSCELGDDGRGHTYDTLVKLREKHPERDYLLITGDDKLGIIPRWNSARKLLSEFGLVVTARGNAKSVISTTIRNNPVLSEYSYDIYIMDRLDGQEFRYSSTDARGHYSSSDFDALAACCGFQAAMAMWMYRRNAGRLCAGHWDTDEFKKWRDYR